MVKKCLANAKKRNAEYNRIKSNLFKKAREFSTLCEVPVCTIIYPEKRDDQTQKSEAFSFNCGSEVPPAEIIQRYLAVPEKERNKRLRTVTASEIGKNDQNFESVNQDYGAMCSANDGSELLNYLDSKIDYVKRKIAMKKSESEIVQIISNNQVAPLYLDHNVGYNNQTGSYVGDNYGGGLMGSNSSSSYYDQITGFNHNVMPLQLDQYDNRHTQKDEVFSISNNQVAPLYFDHNGGLVGSSSSSCYHDQIGFNHNAMPLQLDQCDNHHTQKDEVFSFNGGFDFDVNNAYQVGSNAVENYDQGFYGMNMMGPTCYDQAIGFDNNVMSSQCCDSNSSRSTMMGNFDDPRFYFF